MTTTKKTPTKQNKRDAKAAEKAKAKKQPPAKSVSKGKCPNRAPESSIGLIVK